MRIVHISDLHIGKKLNGFSLLEDQKYILNQIYDIIISKKADSVCIAGDVYNTTTPQAEAVEIFDDFLTKLSRAKINVFMISGNHDSAEKLSFGSEIMADSNVFISKKIDKKLEKITLKDEYGDVNFYLMPFVKPAFVRNLFPDEEIKTYEDAVKKILSEQDFNFNERNIILVHQFITGAISSDSEEKMVGGIENVPAEVFENFDYTALGHIHRPQRIKKNIIYSGSILKYSFSEAPYKKTVPIVDMKEKGNISIEFVPLTPLRDMREIKGKYDELILLDSYKNTNTEDYIHATLTDEVPITDAIRKLRVVYKNLMKLDYEKKATIEANITAPDEKIEIMTPEKIIEEFFYHENEMEMNEQQKEFVKKILEEMKRA